MTSVQRLHRTALLLLLTAISGCTTFGGFLDGMQQERRSRNPVPFAERPVSEPLPANHFVLESAAQSVVGEPQVVLARAENTLSDIARAYGLGYDELVQANPDVDPWLPGDGTPVLLPTQFVLPNVPREGIVLNIASKRLFYFPRVPEGQRQIVKTYPIGIGRVGWETPLGSTRVVSKATDPAWYVPASIRREHAELGNPLPAVVPPGPDNPLGAHVLQLEMPGYLIHGTNQPAGVGMRVSHGCIRLYPENIALLYELVEIGEPVRIINEPFLLGQVGGEVYFEGHAPLEDDPVSPPDRIDRAFAAYESAAADLLSAGEKDHARALASIGSGVPARIATRDAAEVFARARLVRNTAALDPDAPTLTEVREMIDEAVREAEAM
jgi:L,D-transpeptidase ErfK/SrfK